MGFNCAKEKAKFDREWAKLREEYRTTGMSEDAIQKLYEYDWHCFCRNRAYARRAVQMPELEIDDPNDERRSALFKKEPALSTTFDETSFRERYAWKDTVEDVRLVQGLRQLTEDDLELLTYVLLEGHSQTEFAVKQKRTQKSVSRQYIKIKKIFSKKRLKK